MTNEIRTAVFIILILFVVGLILSAYLTKKQNSETLVKWPIVAGPLLGVSIGAQSLLTGINAANNGSASQSHVSVSVIDQGLLDFRESEMTLELLELHSNSLKEAMGANAVLTPGDSPYDVEASYVFPSGKKLGVIRAVLEGNRPAAQIFGKRNSDATTVVCVVSDGSDVPIQSGPCDEKIREVFGVSLAGEGSTDG